MPNLLNPQQCELFHNIPKLDEYVIRLVVLNERMLGYIYPDKISFVVALAVEPGDCVSLLDAINMRRYVSFDDKVRLATDRDFDDFNVCFEGFRNDPMYMYNKGTEPIYI